MDWSIILLTLAILGYSIAVTLSIGLVVMLVTHLVNKIRRQK